MKRKRAFLFLLALHLLVCGVARADKADKGVYNFKGGVATRADKGLTKEELKPMESPGGFFSWTYTFMCYLDDKSSMMIQFTYWKLYIKEERGLYFAFSDADGNLSYNQSLYPAEAMSYQDDPPYFKMGPNYWKGYYPEFDVHVDFEADEDRPAMKGDIHFNLRTPGWRPGEGPVHYGAPDGPWYDLIVMIPWADVEGTVVIGGKERKIKGWGYSDHNTQSVFPTEQLSKLYALRSFSDEYSINFLDYIATEKHSYERSTWILVMKGDEILYATDKWQYEPSSFQAEERRGYQFPTVFNFKIDEPECRLTGELRGVKYIGAIDAMDNLPGFIRAVAEKFVSAPVFTRQNAEVDYHLVMPGKGINEKFTAEGVFEATFVK